MVRATGRLVGAQRVTPRKVAASRRLRREQTPAEAVLWERLRNRRLAGVKFRRQQVIYGFIVDFYSDQARLVVEVDGSSHDQRQAYDRRRDAVIAALGLTILRFTNADVLLRLDPVLAVIAHHATQACSRADSTPPLQAGEGGGG